MAEGGIPMNALKGTVRNGQVIFDEAADLPDGTRVEVTPLLAPRPALGMREEDWPTTPEGVAALLKRWEEPGWLTPEEEAAWKSGLREEKEYEKGRFTEDGEKLGRMWE